MTGLEIVAKVTSLKLPGGSFLVYGSGPLAIAGLREAEDIDLYVTQKVLQKLESAGWRELRKGPNDTPLVQDVFEAHAHWNFSAYSPTLDHLLRTATQVGGVPFASLEEVRKWKVASGRAKDLADVRLIDSYRRDNPLKRQT